MAATETLLVVENETAIKALVQMALERHGYVVLTAESGNEALRLAAAHEGPIHLLITDVVMPDLRGPEVARRLVLGSCRLHPETVLTQRAGGHGA